MVIFTLVGTPFLLYCTVYKVLFNKPEIEILPPLLPQMAGFTEVTVPAFGVGGVGFTFITTLDARERQPNILCVTLIVYVPVAMGNMVVLFEEANTSPAFGAEADQVYTAPTVFVTLKATELPKQTGFGKAAKPAGAEGAVGLVKLTGQDILQNYILKYW